MIFANNLILSTLKKILKILPKQYRSNFYKMVLLFNLNSILELIGITSILPILLASLSSQEDSIILRKTGSFIGSESKFEILLFLSGISVFLLIVKTIFNLYVGKREALFTYRVQRFICLNLHNDFFSEDLNYYKSRNSNDIFREINVIPGFFTTHVLQGMMKFLNEIFIIIFLLVALTIYQTITVLSIVVILLPVVYLAYIIIKKQSSLLAETLNENGQMMYRSIYTSLGGFIDVVLTNAKNKFLKFHAERQDQVIEIKQAEFVLKLLPAKVIEAATILLLISIVLIGSYYYENNEQILGVLVAMGLAAYKIIPSLNKIMVSLNGIKGYQYTFEIVDKVINKTIFPFESKPAIDNLDFEKSIVIDKVSFTYPKKDKLVLDEIEIKINKGERVGFIGVSGSGKSTLINILIGLLTPKSGQILIDNLPIKEELITSYRKKLGYVQQEVFMADATLAENIAFSEEAKEIDYEKINKVIEVCQLKDFVSELPLGLQTQMGEKGGLFSGGQKQRVAIARALYYGAEILLFDEATSALDNQTEAQLNDSIELLPESLTIIVVAHRYTSLKFCDKIYELKNGQIKGERTYSELINEVI